MNLKKRLNYEILKLYMYYDSLSIYESTREIILERKRIRQVIDYYKSILNNNKEIVCTSIPEELGLQIKM